MTSMDKLEYKIDLNKLKRARDVLRNKVRTPEEDRELFFLSTFIENDNLVGSVVFAKSDFQTAFRRDSQDLLFNYFDYLQYIFEFYDNTSQDLEYKPYLRIVSNREDIFTSVHDFYKNLDNEWF